MIERIKPISIDPKDINYYSEQTPLSEVVSARIANANHDTGWSFSSGDPEFWKYSDKLFVKNGKALDLGMGFGRSSLFFAMNGMNVVGYETGEQPIAIMNEMKKIFDLPIEIRKEDFTGTDLGENIYDTAFLAQTLVHSPSEETAFDLIERTATALKTGGRLWLRTSGIYDDAKNELYYYSQYSPEISYEEENLYYAPCSCSGEWKIEPQLFLDPVKVAAFLASRGMKIEYSNIIPDYEKANILFGEDWNPDQPQKDIYNFITFITRK